MSDDVLVLLSLFDGKECLGAASLFIFPSLPSFLRRKVGVYVHESCGSPNVFIFSPISVVESSDQIHYTHFVRLSAHIKENDEPWVKVSTKPLEKPEMGRQFGSIEMLETGKNLQFFSIWVP